MIHINCQLYETNTHDNRIIYTDKEEGNVQMTERTIEVLEKEMASLHKKVLARRFIYGPGYSAVAVSFDLEHDTDCSDSMRERNFKCFQEGFEKGVVVPVVKALDNMDTEVCLSNGLMKEINQVSMDILREEAEELRKLRAELRYLEKTEPASLNRWMDQYAAIPKSLR